MTHPTAEVPTLSDERVTLRPLTADDAEALAAIAMQPGVSEWLNTAEGDDPEELSEELRNEGRAFAIEVEGELAGWLAFDEELDPDYRHAGLDLFLAPRFQDQGLGPAVLRLAASWLIDERGHHRLTIDPAARNRRAIRAYAAVGFRPVGVMRRYERGRDGSFHDGLLMDLLADELRRE